MTDAGPVPPASARTRERAPAARPGGHRGRGREARRRSRPGSPREAPRSRSPATARARPRALAVRRAGCCRAGAHLAADRRVLLPPGRRGGPIRGKIRVLITADTGRDVQVAAERGLKVTSLARNRTWRVPALAARGRSGTWWPRATARRSSGPSAARWRTWKTFRGEAEFTAADGGAPRSSCRGHGATTAARWQSVGPTPGRQARRRSTSSAWRPTCVASCRRRCPRSGPPQPSAPSPWLRAPTPRSSARTLRLRTTTCATPRSARSTAASTSSTRPPPRPSRPRRSRASSTRAGPAFTQFSASNGQFLVRRLDALPRRAARPLRRARQPDLLHLERRRSTTPRSRSSGPRSAT